MQAAEPTQPIVLKAAYLFDSKSGNLTNGGAVLVEGDKIKALGSQAVPANAKVIDLGDATLLPGFIDAGEAALTVEAASAEALGKELLPALPRQHLITLVEIVRRGQVKVRAGATI